MTHDCELVSVLLTHDFREQWSFPRPQGPGLTRLGLFYIMRINDGVVPGPRDRFFLGSGQHWGPIHRDPVRVVEAVCNDDLGCWSVTNHWILAGFSARVHVLRAFLFDK